MALTPEYFQKRAEERAIERQAIRYLKNRHGIDLDSNKSGKCPIKIIQSKAMEGKVICYDPSKIVAGMDKKTHDFLFGDLPVVDIDQFNGALEKIDFSAMTEGDWECDGNKVEKDCNAFLEFARQEQDSFIDNCRQNIDQMVRSIASMKEKWIKDTLKENGYKYILELFDGSPSMQKSLLQDAKIRLEYKGNITYLYAGQELLSSFQLYEGNTRSGKTIRGR